MVLSQLSVKSGVPGEPAAQAVWMPICLPRETLFKETETSLSTAATGLRQRTVEQGEKEAAGQVLTAGNWFGSECLASRYLVGNTPSPPVLTRNFIYSCELSITMTRNLSEVRVTIHLGNGAQLMEPSGQQA